MRKANWFIESLDVKIRLPSLPDRTKMNQTASKGKPQA